MTKKETMNNTVYKTFKLHPDQKEIVEAALKTPKQQSGTKSDTVALELICQEINRFGWLQNPKAAITAELKK